MPTIAVARLARDRAAAYRALMLEAYALHPDAFTSSVAEREPLPLRWWEARMGSEATAHQVVFGALVDDTLAGVAGIGFEQREKATHKATLFGMYVPDRFRQLGLGRRLVAAVLDHAKSRPATLLVQLTVTDGNAAAQRLYESCGFIRFGTEPLAVRVGAGYVNKVHLWRLVRSPPEPWAGAAAQPR
jgi:RimJ/RimL family protein N-acetyltransferase